MAYIRNAWYVAAWSHDIIAEHLVSARVLNEPIVIWRGGAGNVVALEDRCVHRLAPLSLGRCEGERLRCMYHGLLYDSTGRVLEIPGQDRIPDSLRVRAYPVVERHSWVWVWMGDVAAADEQLIPPVVGMDDPRYIFGHGDLDFAAEARLVSDNLLDLSHTSFLHRETFGVSETWARVRPHVAEHGRSVRSERWIRSEGIMGTVDPGNLVDTYFRYDFFVPGVLLMAVRTYPVGTADALSGTAPDLEQAAVSITSQAVTPLTERSARYFYIMGSRPHGDERSYDMVITHKAFAEDKTMIEGQQRNLDITPSRRFVATAADEGVVLFNRLIEKLAREESAQLGHAH